MLAAAVAASCFNAFCFTDTLYGEIPLALVATSIAILHDHAERTGSRTSAALVGTAVRNRNPDTAAVPTRAAEVRLPCAVGVIVKDDD